MLAAAGPHAPQQRYLLSRQGLGGAGENSPGTMTLVHALLKE